MPIVALEEHIAPPDVLQAWRRAGAGAADPAVQAALARASQLGDVGEGRLAAMDRAGVDTQVLSLTTPGLQDLPAPEAVALQGVTNDWIAAAVTASPGRLQGLAALATPSPDQAAAELVRAVRQLGLNGAMVFPRTAGRWLDEPEFRPVLEAASELRAPLYLHPQTPPAPVRAAYYTGFGAEVDAALATHGVGWHYDAGISLVRLILAGVFDRLPDLRVIIGHWGELVLFFLERLEQLGAAARLPRRLTDYFKDHVMVTPSGILSPAYQRWALETVGPDRVMFALDSPFVDCAEGAAVRFLDGELREAADRDKVAWANWQRVCAGIRR